MATCVLDMATGTSRLSICFGQHGAVGDLARLGRAVGLLRVPEDAFHVAVDEEAAVVAGVNVEGMLAHGDGVLDRRACGRSFDRR